MTLSRQKRAGESLNAEGVQIWGSAPSAAVRPPLFNTDARFSSPKRSSRPKHRRRKSPEKRFEEQLKIKRRLADTLEALGEYRSAEKVRSCYSTFSEYRCSNGHGFVIPTIHCRHLLCPFCQRERARRYLARFAWFIDSLALKKRGKYLVLAMKNVPIGGLKAGIDALWNAFRALQKRPGMTALKNSLAKLEVTFNARDKSWHPHLNVIFDGAYIAFAKINAAWQYVTRITRGGTSFIRAVDRGTARELVKYVCKSAEFADNAEAVAEFVQTLRGAQILRRYGTFRKIGEPGDERGHLTEHTLRCPDCGATEIFALGLRGRNEIHRDERGIFRARAPATA